VQLSRASLATLLLLLAAACGDRGGPGAAPPPRYTIACDSADTSDKSTLFCVRTDSRNGDVSVVDLDRLPITSGAARAADENDGTYQTVCDSTVTPQKSDFRCVRIHTRTGDVVVLRLAELPRWPRP
jgi:hypothetical protein